MQLEIVFENEAFIVINKPAGLLSIPDREGKDISLKKILREKYGDIFTVHRIDRETSGLIVFAKNEATHKFLSAAFEDREVDKFYQGFVIGSIPEKEGTIEEPLAEHPAKNGRMVVYKKGKPATTAFKVVEELGPYSFVEFQIFTGRTHQIRVHMKHIGHPLVCDDLYGDGKPVFISSIKKKYKLAKAEEEERPMLSRLALHAWKLHFKDEDGVEQRFEAQMPKDMRALLQQLRKWQ